MSQMDRSLANGRSAARRLFGWTAAMAGVLAASGVAKAQISPAPETAYELVKRFDFDERSIHYDEEPMHWRRLRGPGLPLHLSGGFDMNEGRTGPPSFRLEVRSGSIVYRYEHLDIMLAPESDYLVSGWIRTQGLRHASAFISIYLIDRFKERVPGSELVSELRRGDGDWTRVQISVPGEHATGWAMRIECWVLQDYAWRDFGPRTVDPIVRVETSGAAWFDDIEVFRLPRTVLRFSNPEGLVRHGERGALVVEANNATTADLVGEMLISDENERLIDQREIRIPGLRSIDLPAARTDDRPSIVLTGRRASRVETPTPDLPPGVYTARMRLNSDGGTLIERSLRFAVLNDLSGVRPSGDVGVQLGRWPDGADVSGAAALLESLGAGAAKVGVPLGEHLGEGPASAYYASLAELIRRLSASRIQPTGMLLAEDPDTGAALRLEQVLREGDVNRMLQPVFGFFGALAPNWQLGPESISEDAADPWTAEEVGRVREALRRFVTFPRLVVPRALTSPDIGTDELTTIVAPREAPTRDLPAAWASRDPGLSPANDWLHLDVPANRISSEEELVELARRLAMSKALNPDRLYVPAPFETLSLGSSLAWQPGTEFLVVRTMFHYLGGKQAVGVLYPADDVIALLFEGGGSNCLVAWTWNVDPQPQWIPMYLGRKLNVVDYRGHKVETRSEGERTLLPVSPAPILVDGLDLQLALLQSSFSITPDYLEAHRSEDQPRITFTNPYGQPLVGRLRIHGPRRWQIHPAEIDVSLGAHERFEHQLSLNLPTRELAKEHPLEVTLTLYAPEPIEMTFDDLLTLGLRDIEITVTPYWQGDTLVIEQVLRNLTQQPVRFDAYCAAPGRRRLEGVFLDVLPGETATQVYELPDAQNLRLASVDVGVSEIGGRRRVDQVVQIPE